MVVHDGLDVPVVNALMGAVVRCGKAVSRAAARSTAIPLTQTYLTGYTPLNKMLSGKWWPMAHEMSHPRVAVGTS